MKFKSLSLLLLSGTMLTANVQADSKVEQLLLTLHQPQTEYVMRDEDYYIDAKILKNSHVVGWVKAPWVDISRQDYLGYQRPVSIEMTVLALTGRIVETKIQQSSGSKRVDAQVQKALKEAVLEKIPYADAYVTYVLQQKFDIEKPL